MRVLVIDDEIEICRLINRMLSDEGYDVIDAANGKEGMSLFYKHPFNLVITDIIMPEKEGIETILELKKNFPETKILAISGGGRIHSKDYLQMAKMTGADLTLKKPFIKSELMKCVNELMSA